MGFCNWSYTLQVYQPQSYGSSLISKSFTLNTLLRADMSKAVAGAVDEASFQLADPQHALANYLNLKPMDVVRFSTNSPYSAQQEVIWTGYVDSAVRGMDAQAGDTLVIDATSPFKQWEITSVYVPPPNNLGGPNDVAALAIAALNGIGARDLIRVTANRVLYPGPLGAIPQPAGLQFYDGPELSGQRTMSLPDVWALPDQPTYASILSALAADTGMELFFDEFGSLIFRPIHYLIMPPGGPYRLNDDHIFQDTFTTSDINVITRMRIRWQQDYLYASDGYWQAPASNVPGINGLEDTIGVRTQVVQEPWLWSLDAANFVAASIGQMSAAGISGATMTIPANPAIRVGNVIQVMQDNAVRYFYVAGTVYSLEWGKAWTMTLNLQYGRDVRLQFPLLHSSLEAQDVTSAVLAGIPQGTGGLTFVQGGQLAEPFTILKNPTITGSADVPATEACIGPFPVGTVIAIKQLSGAPFAGSSRTGGKYICVQQTADTTSTGANTRVEIKDNAGITQGLVYIIQVSPSISGASSPVSSPGSGVAGLNTSAGASVQGTTPSSTSILGVGGSTATNTSNSAATAYGVPFFPVKGGLGLLVSPNFQGYGVTSFSGEPPLCMAPHYHLGIDLPVPSGTPLYAVADGVVTWASMAPVGLSGFGNMVFVSLDNTDYWAHYAHLSSFRVNVGDRILGGKTIVGLSGGVAGVPGSGNSTGAHLHFGIRIEAQVATSCSLGFTDPIPLLLNSQD